jgi:hypothetical protein
MYNWEGRMDVLMDGWIGDGLVDRWIGDGFVNG